MEIDFDKRARGSDPQTSHDAAARVIDFAHGHYALILGALGLHRETGGTIYELAGWTGLTHVQVARRTAELHDAGRAAPADETRPGPSKRGCRVWRLP